MSKKLKLYCCDLGSLAFYVDTTPASVIARHWAYLRRLKLDQHHSPQRIKPKRINKVDGYIIQPDEGPLYND